MAKVVFNTDNRSQCNNCGFETSMFKRRLMYACQAMNCSTFHISFCEDCIKSMGAVKEGSFFSSHYKCPTCNIGVMKEFDPLRAEWRPFGK